MAEKKRGSERTALTLSLSVEDKKALKNMAAEQQTTVAKMVSEWIAEKKAVRK